MMAVCAAANVPVSFFHGLPPNGMIPPTDAPTPDREGQELLGPVAVFFMPSSKETVEATSPSAFGRNPEDTRS